MQLVCETVHEFFSLLESGFPRPESGITIADRVRWSSVSSYDGGP